jgi:hypothetical protein
MKIYRKLLMLLGISSKRKLGSYYSSINDLPQWNWNKIHDTGNLAYLEKLDNYRNLQEKETEGLVELWHLIYDDFLLEFGLSDNYREVLRKQKEIANLKLQYINTSDRHLLNLIEIEELELKSTFDNTHSLGFERICVEIEKKQGIKITNTTRN